ncbi:MAG TPA: NAD-dependent epimerase/dehydratase family protein, partial [Desulfobulbus sp.]|nr:NAD-dependent epimerase/dehydratase family protein [Desulfobulbus sp.]
MKSSFLSVGTRLYVAGHRGMVGSAIVRKCRQEGMEDIVTRNHAELDLLDQRAVHDFFRQEKIDCVILAAARVGGILANSTWPADFIYQNLVIE